MIVRTARVRWLPSCYGAHPCGFGAARLHDVVLARVPTPRPQVPERHRRPFLDNRRRT